MVAVALMACGVALLGSVIALLASRLVAQVSAERPQVTDVVLVKDDGSRVEGAVVADSRSASS